MTDAQSWQPAELWHLQKVEVSKTWREADIGHSSGTLFLSPIPTRAQGRCLRPICIISKNTPVFNVNTCLFDVDRKQRTGHHHICFYKYYKGFTELEYNLKQSLGIRCLSSPGLSSLTSAVFDTKLDLCGLFAIFTNRRYLRYNLLMNLNPVYELI